MLHSRKPTLLLATFAVSVVAACTPGPGEIPREPDPHLGIGSVSGELRFTAAEVKFYDDAAAQNGSFGNLVFFTEYHAIFPSTKLNDSKASGLLWPTRSQKPEDIALERTTQFNYSQPFSFAQMPLDSYAMLFFRGQPQPYLYTPASYTDYGGQFVLTRQQPSVTGVISEFELPIGAGLAQGKLLINGDRSQSWAVLSWAGSSNTSQDFGIENFRVELKPQNYGRVWYEATGVPTDHHYVRVYGTQTYNTSHWRDERWMGPTFELEPGVTEFELNMATRTGRLTPNTFSERNDIRGVLNGTVNTEAIDWLGDVVIEARNVAEPGGNDLAWAYVMSGGREILDFGEYGLLHNLKVGTYRVRLIGLADTNAGEHTTLAERQAVIAPPEQVVNESNGQIFSYWHAPQGSVSIP